MSNNGMSLRARIEDLEDVLDEIAAELGRLRRAEREAALIHDELIRTGLGPVDAEEWVGRVVASLWRLLVMLDPVGIQTEGLDEVLRKFRENLPEEPK